MPSPLRARSNEDGHEGPETPEALMISALLDDGLFEPEKYGLSEKHLGCWLKLWRFCADYQNKEGRAPDLTLVQSKFPDFEFTPRIGARWAADQLHKAHFHREARRSVGVMVQALKDEDHHAVMDAVRDLEPPQVISKPAVGMWDINDEQDFEVSKIPVPYTPLGRATGGIGQGEFWLLGARPGQGKTWTVCTYVAAAMKQAYNVHYISLEMPSKVIIKRVRRLLAANDPKLLARLDSKDFQVVKKAVDELKERVDGSLHVVDPSHGKGTAAMVESHMGDSDLVVVDHVGLLYATTGQRAVHDWRAQAEISNDLKAAALRKETPVLAAVQLNRLAEGASDRAPGADKVGGSDALVQDADVVVTMKRLSRSVMIHSAEKVREGEGVEWRARFDPDKAKFDEVTYDQSLELQALDDDRDALNR